MREVTKKILLINSDLAKNRGDRAIAEGNIELIRERFPDAQILGISQHPERDERWYGIAFLDMDFQSLNPLEALRLARIARRSDAVFWGGGEILKDYTNKLALWYWCVKMTLISLYNKNLYGAFQGIGPTRSAFSRRLIRFVVSRCRLFLVRDEESREKLLSWGVPAGRVVASSDPAVLPVPDPVDGPLAAKLRDDAGVDDGFLDNFVCVAPREWFHYKQSGLIPFKYKKKILSMLGRDVSRRTPEFDIYVRRVVELVAQINARYRTNVLLVPMHMEEGDADLCRRIAEEHDGDGEVRILEADTLSAAEVRSVISEARMMIGFRLHSNIIGVSSGVPSLNIYYVDKGRVFFDQIEQENFALPIEFLLEDEYSEVFFSKLDELDSSAERVRHEIDGATARLRQAVRTSFGRVNA